MGRASVDALLFEVGGGVLLDTDNLELEVWSESQLEIRFNLDSDNNSEQEY